MRTPFRNFAIAALVVAGTAFMPSRALADNNTLANAYTSMLGEVRSDFVPTATASYFRYELTANRSYLAVCWYPFEDGGGSDCPVDWRNASDASVSSGGDVEPFVFASSNFIGDADAVRPTVSGTYYVRADNVLGAGTTLHVMVVETTLFCPWYFINTTSGYESYVEIKNNTSGFVNVAVRGYNGAGTLVGTTNVSLPAEGGTLVFVGSTFGITSGSGTLTIAHDGSPGAITANTTTLSTTTGLSFDAPFQPRMAWGTFQ